MKRGHLKTCHLVVIKWLFEKMSFIVIEKEEEK